MIIYGTRGKHFSTQELAFAKCPNCQKVGGMQVALVSRYAHVYWIPLFPFQKIPVVECTYCGTSWEDKAVPAGLADDVATAKAQARHPYWTWLGLALIAVASVFGVLAALRNNHDDDAFLEAPRAGDIYTIRSDSASTYSLWKVRQVSGNSVELLANEYETSSSTDILKNLDSPERYSKEPFILTRLDLQIMRRKGQLTDVDRL